MKEHVKAFYESTIHDDQKMADHQMLGYSQLFLSLVQQNVSQDIISQVGALYHDAAHRSSKLVSALHTLANHDNSIDKSDQSKLEKALAIYDRMKDTGASRVQIIERIMGQLAMSKAGASSYYTQARERSELSDAEYLAEHGGCESFSKLVESSVQKLLTYGGEPDLVVMDTRWLTTNAGLV